MALGIKKLQYPTHTPTTSTNTSISSAHKQISSPQSPGEFTKSLKSQAHLYRPAARPHAASPLACRPLASHAAARPPVTHRKFSIAMRTIEPSTKGPDDSSSGGAAGGTELFFLLGTSDEGSLRTALLEARELGVDVFLLGVAILAGSLPGCGFRSHLPAAPARRRPTPARTALRATAREPAPAPAQSLPGSVSGPAPPLRLSRVLGGPSWREWDAVAHGTPREAATGLLCTFLLFSDFFFLTQKKNVSCI